MKVLIQDQLSKEFFCIKGKGDISDSDLLFGNIEIFWSTEIDEAYNFYSKDPAGVLILTKNLSENGKRAPLILEEKQ